MARSNVNIEGLNTNEQAEQLQHRLSQMIGVKEVIVSADYKIVEIEYETPTNLNSIEKEIYDDGFKVLN
ncbi:heavy-metal-associated domain-containing protein [Staphylococcus sp. NRL 16/872]|uniref:putative copper chaperone CsoZ n=1 Tax=Staphylococcus sp. NRL 16/872 TaxID=2930131 RepID=UPI001FB4595D|nr:MULTISPECIES: heavy-metal-associated domain-containing protein [unclassified Staphylococcus]MCJ1655930.1 heavy-metal-associated domain-containing protein [Staphylococcus sp. NRL 21/187]MCJ1661726.1 heavy-metal-associated domain-containing protein [Staphylococcus sp. NRL 18/288]MCJ1667664.1 heavy-metal-associated domain-containing protein [Staphylococcus sp. NRL 19/737]WEN70154.1 heavy-metal-associated domain-containing protein [Staphylococcus sp. NRL 16/872]